MAVTARPPTSFAELRSAFQAGDQPKCSLRGEIMPSPEWCRGYAESGLGCAVAEEGGQFYGAIVFKRNGQVEWLYCSLSKWRQAVSALLAYAKTESGGAAPFGRVENAQARTLFANEPGLFVISGEDVRWRR